MTVGLPLRVEDCTEEPQHLRPGAIGLLGTYVIPSGKSDQLAYVTPLATTPFLHDAPDGGRVTVDGKRLWYDWNYARFGHGGGPNNLLLWYTDGAQHELRWTCITYGLSRGLPKPSQSEWTVLEQQYGKEIPPAPLLSDG